MGVAWGDSRTNIRVHEEQIRRKEEQLQRCEEKDAIAKEDLATHTRIQGDLDQEAKKVARCRWNHEAQVFRDTRTFE